jgi:uncharacterized protein with ParB-like and HNH nuclease domain
MSKLNVDHKTIKTLFEDKKSDFLIPDYQRPYAWTDEQCQTLWDDLFSFAIPDNDYQKFDDENAEYFLGTIVTFKNNELGKLEVIDGQQRLTTLMLLLRAFYVKLLNMQDEPTVRTRETISQCIWKTDAFGKANLDILKINSEVATDNDKEEFLKILKSGEVNDEQKSNYANNYRFFKKKIDEFVLTMPSCFAYLPNRILKNCIFLPIESEEQDTALQIFSTLNDRGLPLSDADIFKAQFYKFYGDKGEKDNFIDEWKTLEGICVDIFHPITGTPMDELFTRYMYYVRAKQGIKSSTTEALRKFYEKGKYSLLKKEETFENLKILANFWKGVAEHDDERFSDDVLKKLFVLNYAPNGMWNYFVSVYFMHNKDKEGKLEDKQFSDFLSKITAFIWVYAVNNPGVNALRTPVYAEMMNIVNDKPVDFNEFKFDLDSIRISFNNYEFKNGRPITKSMLAWWAFNNHDQTLPKIDTAFDIEHIFPKNRQKIEKTLADEKSLEALGNKSLLEKRINIRATDYRFSDKVKYYKGEIISKRKTKEKTQINELIELAANHTDFTETDIKKRNKEIIEGFLSFVHTNSLIK